MKKWFKISGIVAALAALSVLSFAAVSFAQTETPDAQPGLVERFRSGMQDHFGGPGGTRGMRGGEMNADRTEQNAVLAEALGMTEDELQAARDAGQTLTEIAEAQGVDLDTLQATLSADRLEAMKTTLAEKVAAGDITQEQADAMLEKMESGDFPGRGGMMGGQDGSRDGMRGHPGGRGGMRGVPGNSTPDSTAPDGTNFQTMPSVDSNL